MSVVALASLLATSLLIGHAPVPRAQRAAATIMADVDERSPQYRAKIAAEKEAAANERRARAAELAFSAAEVEALTDASKSLEPSYTGDIEEIPAGLKSLFTQGPLDFFAVLRNFNEDPDPAVWPAIREKWPVLADKSDDDLLAALQPIKDVKVDRRSL